MGVWQTIINFTHIYLSLAPGAHPLPSSYIPWNLMLGPCRNSSFTHDFCWTFLPSVQFCRGSSFLDSTNTDLSFETQFQHNFLCEAFPKSLSELVPSQNILFLFITAFSHCLTPAGSTGLSSYCPASMCIPYAWTHRNHSNICWWRYKSIPKE